MSYIVIVFFSCLFSKQINSFVNQISVLFSVLKQHTYQENCYLNSVSVLVPALFWFNEQK